MKKEIRIVKTVNGVKYELTSWRKYLAVNDEGRTVVRIEEHWDPVKEED